MHSSEVYAYYKTVEYCANSMDWHNKTAIKSFYKNQLTNEAPHKFKYIANLIANSHFTAEQYKAYVIDCFINGNGKCILTDSLVGKEVRELYKDLYSPERLELDKESFITIHKQVKEKLRIKSPASYMQYNLNKEEYPYSMMFKLLNQNIISPIFYQMYMVKTKCTKPNYEALGMVASEEQFRKLIRLLNFI